MADIVDLAQEETERLAAYVLAGSKRPTGPQPTGFCHSCAEPVALDMRWCDADCRADWERTQAAAARNRA